MTLIQPTVLTKTSQKATPTGFSFNLHPKPLENPICYKSKTTNKPSQMEQSQPNRVCSQEALLLLNCVTQNPYDQDKCILLLDALRNCVTQKKVKKFTLADQDNKEASDPSKSTKS